VPSSMDSAPLFDDQRDADIMQKEGLHLNRQKFQQDAHKLKQLLLTENTVMDAEELEHAVKVIGIILSAPELRVVAALYNKLGDTRFEGNGVPRLLFHRPEFLKLYGIPGKKHCHEADIAFSALLGLTRSFRTVYARSDGRTVTNHEPLITVSTDYGFLTRTEIDEVMCRDVFAKVKTFSVSLAPIWIDEIAKRYLYRPVSLYQEIRDAHDGHRCSDAVYLFHDFVLTLDWSPARIYIETLEHRLWLDRHRIQEHPRRIKEAIKDALETAVATRLLSKYEFDNLRAVSLYLNPDRCRLYSAKEERKVGKQPAPYLSGNATISVGE
jgi:hypothetical protein